MPRNAKLSRASVLAIARVQLSAPGVIPAYKKAWLVMENGCHIWQGDVARGGYGRVHVNKIQRSVHRVRYELEVGPIPHGMVLDHFVCDNPICCNPAHVRPVTVRENTLRGRGITATLAAKTHCKKGHPLSGDNLSPYERTVRGARRCKKCAAISMQQRYARDPIAGRDRMRAYRARLKQSGVGEEQ